MNATSPSSICISSFLFLLSFYQESFLKAAEEAKTLKQKPDNSELSELYGLYKQATVGDVNFGEFREAFQTWTHRSRLFVQTQTCHKAGQRRNEVRQVAVVT